MGNLFVSIRSTTRPVHFAPSVFHWKNFENCAILCFGLNSKAKRSNREWKSLPSEILCGKKIEELISLFLAQSFLAPPVDILSFLNNLCPNIIREKSGFNQIGPCYTSKIVTFSAELLREGAPLLLNSWAVIHARQIIQHPHLFKGDNYFVPNISDFNPGHSAHSWPLEWYEMTFLDSSFKKIVLPCTKCSSV